MNKLIAVVLSISLIFGSVTPSLAQSNKLIKGAQKALQQTGKELVSGGANLPKAVEQVGSVSAARSAQTALSAANHMPSVPSAAASSAAGNPVPSPNAASGSTDLTQLSSSFHDRLQNEILSQTRAQTAPKTLEEIQNLLARSNFSLEDAQTVYHQIFNVDSRSASVKEFLLFNTLPTVSVERGFAIPQKYVNLAVDFYRRTLLSNLQEKFPFTNAASLEEIVSVTTKSPNFEEVARWSKSMAAVSNLGFYGSAKDAALLLKVYKNTPASLQPITEVVVGRSLLNLQAYREIEELASLCAKDGALSGEFWKGLSSYAKQQGLDLALPAVQEQAAVSFPKQTKRILGAWYTLNARHLDPSAQATHAWAELNAHKGQVIADPAAAAEAAPAVQEIPNNLASGLKVKELSLESAQLTDDLLVGKAPVPSSAAESAAAKTADGQDNVAALEKQKTEPEDHTFWGRLRKKINNIDTKVEKYLESRSTKPYKADIAPISTHFSASIDARALSRAINIASGKTSLINKAGNRKIIKRAQRALLNAKSLADTKFIPLARTAQQEGRVLTSADYDKIFSEEFTNQIAGDPRLAPYAKEIAASLTGPEGTPAKREISYSLKLHDANGKVLPITFELNIRLLDNKAVKQFERLGITNSEVFTLMRAIKDGVPSGPFELMLTTPGGSKRPIYEPFIEGGKAAVEAMYYRLLGDYQTGKLKSNKVDLNLFSDSYAERATLSAGLTEGLGGLPQSTVAPQATALNISNAEKLQEGVSHSQLGNVASVIFSGLQKQFGIKNTLALGLGIAALGLGVCGFALSLPSIELKIGMLGIGSFILGVGANGGVKSTNSIFAKEISNDNTSGTARMGFVNARASVGTMTGYLFFPVSLAFALTGVEAFQWLYYGATAVPAFALANLLLSKARNVGAETGVSSSLMDKTKVVLKTLWDVGKNILHNISFTFGGGYKERLNILREKRIVKERTKQYKNMVNGHAPSMQEPVARSVSNSFLSKTKKFFSLQVPAAFSQYLWRMMALVFGFHLAGMLYNSGPGAIIGNFINSPKGADVVNWVHNMPVWLTAILAGGAAYGASKVANKLYKSIKKKLTRADAAEIPADQPTTLMGKAKAFAKKNFPWIATAATMGATAVSPAVYEVFRSVLSHLDPTSIAQIGSFLTAYVGVWLGRQYLSQLVKKGKLSPQGIIGASGVLSTVSVGLAFLPFLPLGAKAALWAVAGLGFANLASFENSLAMEKYPDQKPAVNMAYTLARLSGALTVVYGSLANTFKAMGVPDPEVNALVFPAGALLIATLMNGKYFTHNFIQDVKRWRGLPPTLNYKLLRVEADNFYKKYQENGHSVEYWDQDAQRIATDLFNKTRHELTTIERLMKPINNKLRLNQLRLSVIKELKELLNGAAQNNAPLGTEALTYKIFKTREIQPLLTSLSGKNFTAEEEAQMVRSVAEVINSRYFIQASELDNMERGVLARNEGLDQFRLEVLRNMYKMQLTKIAEDRTQRYKGNRPSYDRAMAELEDMARKVLGADHDWKAPDFEE